VSIVKYPRQSGWLYDPATFDDGIAFVDGDSLAKPRNGLTANAGSPLATDALGRSAINAQNVNCAIYFKTGDNGQIGPTDGSAQTNTSTVGDYISTGPVAALASVGTGSGATGYSKLYHMPTFTGGVRDPGGKLTINGCLLGDSVAGKWWSHYPTDGTYGSWGNALDIDGGELCFNVPSGKIFDPRIGVSTNNFRRLSVTNGGKITFTGAGKGWPRAFATYLTDAMIQGAGSSTLTDYGFDFFAGSASDPTVTSDGVGVGLATDGSYHYARNVLFDQCGCVNIGTQSGAYYDWDNEVAVLRGKHATTDWRVIGVNTARNATALRRFSKLRVQRGVNITSTVANTSPDNGLEFIDCTLKLVSLSFTNTRCKTWTRVEWEVADGNGQAASSIPADAVSGYLTTGRGTLGNPKVLNCSYGAFALPTIGNVVFDCSQDTNVGSLNDSGEWYQHDKEHRSGTAFVGCTFISAEDGTALRIAEAAFLSNTGNNTTQPPTAGQEAGRVTFVNCRGNIGPSAFGQGHTPGVDCPGTDVWRVSGGTWVGAHANATGSTSQAWSNQTGPSTLVGLINATVDADYTDSVLVAQVTGNTIIRTSTAALKNGGGAIWAQAGGWGIQQSAQDAATTAALFTASNRVLADWGRTANLANYLNSRPGGGPEGPGRRLRTLYLFAASVTNGANTAARDTQYATAWKALAAQGMGAHPAFGGAHPDYVAGVSSTGLSAWVDADWALVPGTLTPGTATATDVPLSWTAAYGGSPGYTYQVQRSTDGGSTFSDYGASTGSTSQTATGLTAATGYKFRVKVMDAASGTQFTNVVTVTTAAGAGGTSITSVSVAPSSASVNVGSTTTLTATVVGTGDTSVTWSSSNTSLATVSSSGVVTGVAGGVVTITATSVQDGSKSSTSTITVNALGVPSIGFSRSNASGTAVTGETTPALDAIEIRNAGGGALTGLSAAKTQTWLTVTLESTTGPTRLILVMNPTGLAAGTYSDTVTIASTAQGLVGGSKTVAVRFPVLATARVEPTAMGALTRPRFIRGGG
jgi:hypothetical protein